MLLGEGFGADDRGGGAAGRRAGHQAGHHAGEDHLVVHHVFGGDDFTEQGQRVIGGMTAGLGANGGEGAQLGAVFLHVFATGAAEHLQGHRNAHGVGRQLRGDLAALAHGTRAVVPLVLQCTRLHLLEAQGQGTFHSAAFYRLTREEQGWSRWSSCC
ncbi:hypothetical protein D9M71_435500 [compost metagenome]